MYSILLALIYMAFISLGLPDSLLGSAWPVMRETLTVPIPFMGIVSMIISGCTILSSLASDRVTRRFGAAGVTVFSVFLSATALLGFAHASAFWMLVVWAVPYGLGAGAIDAALNNYVALHYTSRHMSWLHCFWGLGAMISPFVMSYALATSSWDNGYRIVSLIQFGVGTLLLITLPIWKINRPKTAATESAPAVGLIGALKIRGVPSLLTAFFAYCAAEATAMGWAGTYFAEVRGLSGQEAAANASLFFIGITAGRFVGGFWTDRLGDRRMIRLGTVVSLVGIACLLIPGGTWLAVAGFVIIGLGFAPIYPCIIHSTPDNFGAEHSGAIIGIQMASAYVGATFMPPLYGLLGRFVGYGMMPLYLLVFVIPMIWLCERTFRLTRHS